MAGPGQGGLPLEQPQPYLGLSYLYDYTMSSAVGADQDEIEGVLGLNYFYSDKLTFSLEGAEAASIATTRRTPGPC